ncbi:hypothetical protein KP509_32G029100 [Ceratopteris richardii]|nr:hypothetical protein KP509_32G029100 [Ceratopteris richardii]
MKTQRSFPAEKPDVTCPFFERDWGELQANLVTTSIVKQVEVHTFECGCCCSDVPFEEMVQCADGHLFCCVCLRKSIEESTYGTLPASAALLCLDMAGCDQTIPLSELRRVVEFNLLSKYEERQANDCIAKARLEGLVRCPFCNFACDLDVGIDVLDCPSCWKKSCVKCKEPSHEPLRCEQVEKPSDTEHRRQIEEIMTGSILRHCTACKAVLIKDGGCNKIKCRCGQSMCYVCRSAITDYKHFCNHFREPGKGCSTCKGCFLWDQEDSDAVVLHAKRAALKRKAMDDPNILTREIGPAETLFVSKRKR